jgi:hypothetical protein
MHMQRAIKLYAIEFADLGLRSFKLTHQTLNNGHYYDGIKLFLTLEEAQDEVESLIAKGVHQDDVDASEMNLLPIGLLKDRRCHDIARLIFEQTEQSEDTVRHHLSELYRSIQQSCL